MVSSRTTSSGTQATRVIIDLTRHSTPYSPHTLSL